MEPRAIEPAWRPAILLLQITFDDQFRDDAITAAIRVAVIIVVAWLAIQLLKRFLYPVMRVAIGERMKDDPAEEVEARIETLSEVVYRTGLLVVIVLAGMMLLAEAGVSVAPLIAGVGLVGLAVGFGAQSLVKDVINGLFILIDNQYSKGDVVTLAGLVGIVEDVNLRRTVLRDLDGTVHFIPHSNIDVASNWTLEYSRINLNVGVAYESDLDHVIEVINRVGRELAEDPAFKDKFKAPPSVLRIDNFGESSIDIKVLGETVPLEQWALMGELRLRLKREFDREGIVIPFPQRTLHVEPTGVVQDGSTPLRRTPAPEAHSDMESEARALEDSPDKDVSSSSPSPFLRGGGSSADGAFVQRRDVQDESCSFAMRNVGGI